MFSLDAEKIGNWLTVGASASGPRSVEFSWMNDQGAFYSTIVELKKNASGLFNVDLANSKYWKGGVHQFKLRVLPDSESTAAVTFQSVAVNPQPQGPANISIVFCGIRRRNRPRRIRDRVLPRPGQLRRPRRSRLEVRQPQTARRRLAGGYGS
ncbi:MAG: hypothetical protein M5R36_27110 [Deltaproteobacteria bacterium]|nr:hypothetical protein [Deltaproteobacteria bacterium]